MPDEPPPTASPWPPSPATASPAPSVPLHPGRTLSPPPAARPNSSFVVKRPAHYSPSPPGESGDPSPQASSSAEASTPGTSAAARPPPLARLELPASSKAPGRRVQWPVDLKSPVGGQPPAPPIPMQTMDDTGAREALRTALDALETHDGLPPPRPSFSNANYDVESQVTSEGTTRAPSEAGSEGDLEDIRDQMDVYVDPNETDGMPSLDPEKDAKRNQEAAVALVRAHTSGFFGVLRKRKGHGVKNTTAVTPTREQPPADDGTGAFGRRLRDGGRLDTNYDEMPEAPRSKSKHTGGVLASLLALQGNSDSASIKSASTSSATHSRPGSQYGSEDDDEDDERERLKFIHEYRIKNAWLKGSGTTTPGGKAPHHQRNISAISPEEIRDSSGTPNKRPSSIANFIANRSSTTFRPPSPGSPGSPGSPPPSADSATFLRAPKKSATSSVTSQMRKLGGSLGLEVDHRPSSARSSAGVFGGLMMATNNLAGAAAPEAARVAPDPRHRGFNLSRFSIGDGKKDSPPLRPRPLSMTEVQSSPRSARSSTTLEGDSPAKGGSKSNPGSPLDKPVLKQVKSASNIPASAPPMSPPIFLTDTHTDQTEHLSSPPAAYGPVSNSFSENAKKRRSNLKGLENLTLNMIQAPIKLTKQLTHAVGATTPESKHDSGDFDYFGPKAAKTPMTQEEKEKRAWEKEKRRRKKAREKKRQEQIFITMHVAAILARQDFLLKLTRALMMFGAPSHRLEAQMQATARVLEINCQMVYIPGVMLVSFGDPTTHTSETKFLKQANGLDLGKLLSTHMVYWNVVHDKIGVTEASEALDVLMTSKPTYKLWQHLIIGGLASALIQPSAFYGSLIDCLMSIPLGMLLVIIQVLVSKNDLYSSLFEIVIATINSFLAAAIASTGQFCFASIASGSVVLILPGYIVLVGALEIGNRSIISGSVRLVYAVLYSLFLGFGIAMGCEIYIRITGLAVNGSTDYKCTNLRTDAPWYRATISPWYYFITAPCYLLALSLRNGQPLLRKETLIMVVVGCAGFCCNYFSGRVFTNRPDIASAIGAFVVGILGGLYAKLSRGSAFVIMVAGILFQLPSGLSNGGLLKFAAETTSEDGATQTDAYSSGFQVAQQLIQVAIGLTVGLFTSAALVNLFGGGRRRGANLSSF